MSPLVERLLNRNTQLQLSSAVSLIYISLGLILNLAVWTLHIDLNNLPPTFRLSTELV